MTHELYIDNILMDVDENTKVTMALRSNFLRDVSEITGNSTYTVQLPLTARNREAIGASDVLAVSSLYPYLKHTAKYIRDGVPIIENGVAVLVGVTDKIEILITWGINSNIARLFGDGLKLPELPITNWVEYTQTPSIPTWYGFRNSAPTSFLFYAHADYNDPLEDNEQWKTALDNAWVWQYKRPNVRLSWLISRIQSVYGVTISFPNSLEPFISRLAIPLIKDRAGDVGSDNITVTAWEQKPSGMLFSETNDAAGGVFSQETTPTQTLYVSVGKKVTIHYDIDINVTTAPPFDFVAAQSYMYAKVINVLDGTQLSGYTANFKTKVDQFGTVSVSCHEDVDVEIPDMGYGLQLFVQANEQFVAAYIADKMVDNSQVIKISPDAEHVQFGQHYPIAINLPDITIVDLLRALCVVTGTFPKQTQDNNLVLVPFQTLWDNIPNAEDWTRKVIPSYMEDRPQRVEFTVNGWAQQNLYKWKDIKDRTDNDQFNGEIDIESNTIDKMKTAYNSVFAVPRFNNSGVVRIPLYKINNYDAKAEDPTVPTTYEIKSYEDLLCSVAPYGLGQYASLSEDERPIMLSNEGLRLQDIINERYGRLIGALNQAKIITERFRLHDWDVKEFNETTPIYLQQYGKCFALLEADFSADGVATCKLLQLN